jgi:hypothetical protein
MRTLVVLGWLMIPVAVGAYHYGPGQEQLRLDDASRALAVADREADAQHWPQAADAYERAMALLPPGRSAEGRRLRLERDKAWMLARKLPEASADLKTLVDELQEDESTDPSLLADARGAQANAQYYMTWLMRLEGLPRDSWEPEIEGARQTYRLLAEQARSRGDDAAALDRQEDLESVIRLARMEPGDLQGLAIPKPCQNCKSGQCKNPGRKPGKKPTGDQKPKDARGASSGPPPDRSGS